MAAKVIREGEYFAIPLPSGGYGVGLAARVGSRGVVLGYFSPARHGSIPALADATFSPGQAIWIKLFGDLGIADGEWVVIGYDEKWNPVDWPLPDFAHHEEITGRCYRLSFDGDLRNRPSRTLVPVDQTVELPEYGTAGAQFIEIRLDKILSLPR
ncbi:Imm26 family immunity protein [Kribbella sp. NPDC020789]